MFVPGRLFLTSLMFMGNVRSLLWYAAPERGFTWVGSGLARKAGKTSKEQTLYLNGTKISKNCNHQHLIEPQVSNTVKLGHFNTIGKKILHDKRTQNSCKQLNNPL